MLNVENKPLKIGIEAQRLLRPNKHGMDIVVLELIQNLQQIDRYNQYYVFVKPDEDRDCVRETDNFKIIDVKGMSYPDWEQIQLPRMSKKYKLDILHCTSNTAPIWGVRNLFLTLHDVIYLEKDYFLAKDGGSLYQRFGNLYRRWIVPLIAGKAKRVFTVSDFQKTCICDRLPLCKEKINIVHNGVDKRFFEREPADKLYKIKEKYGLPESYLFFLGNTEPRKNLKGVLHAYGMALKSDAGLPSLVIKGITETFLLQKLQELELEFLRPSIKLVGYIDAPDLPAVYQGARMLLFPSFSEGFGIPIIEAMAGGIPVITSKISSMPEVTGDAAILIDPYKPEEIASSILHLLNDEQAYQSHVDKGLERAKMFSWDYAALKVLNAYETYMN